MKIKLPNKIATSRDIDDIVLELKDYANWHAHAEVKKKSNIKPSSAPDITEEAADLIDQFVGDNNITDHKLDKLINTLLDIRDDSPRITITLAALPTGEIKNKLINWCRANISNELLVDFSHDRSLLGGMVVQCGSHIYDWSFKKKIVSNAKKIPKVLHNV